MKWRQNTDHFFQEIHQGTEEEKDSRPGRGLWAPENLHMSWKGLGQITDRSGALERE